MTAPADPLAAPPRTALRPAALAAASVGALFALALALWAHFGVAAFVEMLASGIANCF